MNWTWLWVAWAVVVATSFGYIEWVSLKHREDERPPLTQVIRKYVPRWLIAVVLGGFAFWGFEHFIL